LDLFFVTGLANSYRFTCPKRSGFFGGPAFLSQSELFKDFFVYRQSLWLAEKIRACKRTTCTL